MKSLNTKFMCESLGIRLTFPSDLLMKIEAMARIMYPKEYGGIFIGSFDKNEIMVTDSVEPLKYNSSAVHFTRYVDDLNRTLRDVYERSQGKITYLGEWHTHPNNTSQYSDLDKRSMLEISHNPQSKTSRPILLIIGINPPLTEVSAYIVNQKKLMKFNNQIE